MNTLVSGPMTNIINELTQFLKVKLSFFYSNKTGGAFRGSLFSSPFLIISKPYWFVALRYVFEWRCKHAAKVGVHGAS